LTGAAILAAVGLALTGCSSSGGGAATGTAPTSSKGTIKIGLIPPTTGNTAAFGKEMLNGWNLYWDQHNNTSAGYTIDSIDRDNGGDATTALSQINELVTSDKVSMVVGALQANIALAIAKPLADAGVPYLEPVASADNLTQRTIPDLFVRLGGHTSSQVSMPLGQYAVDKKLKKVVTVCSDYAFGYEGCGGFVNTFTDGGGKVAAQLWPPLGTSDFSTYIAQIRQAKPDVVFAQFSGADGTRFLQAWNNSGLKDKVTLLSGESVLDETSLDGLTEPVVGGLISAGVWASDRKAATVTAFDKLYEAKYQNPPSFYATSMYVAAESVDKAIQKLNGDVSDAQKFVDTVKSIGLSDTPMGDITIDKYDNSVQDVYIRKVVEVNGKLENKVVKTYPKVTQFWTYDPTEFLAHPVYSKKYQGDGVWPDPK
jgi:branched-chain amino acid transport system substrate-binding protein